MCIFTLGVTDVSDTRIFVRKGRGVQVLAYQMTLQADGELAMVLPLPVDDSRRLEFINLEKHGRFFDKLAEWLPIWSDELSMDQLSMGAGGSSIERPVLEVHQVGEYEASFVPTLGDFDRLDARFRLPPEVLGIRAGYQDWGFAVFKLRDFAAGARPRHPMALWFSTRFPHSLFVPTVHVHDGRIHPLAKFDHQIYFQTAHDLDVHSQAFKDGNAVNGDENSKARLLAFGIGLDNPTGYGLVCPSMKNYFQSGSSARTPEKIGMDCAEDVLEPGIPLRAFGLRGILPNQDVWLDLPPGRIRTM